MIAFLKGDNFVCDASQRHISSQRPSADTKAHTQTHSLTHRAPARSEWGPRGAPRSGLGRTGTGGAGREARPPIPTRVPRAGELRAFEPRAYLISPLSPPLNHPRINNHHQRLSETRAASGESSGLRLRARLPRTARAAHGAPQGTCGTERRGQAPGRAAPRPEPAGPAHTATRAGGRTRTGRAGERCVPDASGLLGGVIN